MADEDEERMMEEEDNEDLSNEKYLNTITKNGATIVKKLSHEVVLDVRSCNSVAYLCKDVVDKHYSDVLQEEIDIHNQGKALPQYQDEQETNRDTFSIPHDAYDIFLTDGTKITKCALSPINNYLVESCTLRQRSLVKIIERTLVYDEKVIGGGGVVLLRKVQILSENDLSLTAEAFGVSSYNFYETIKKESLTDEETNTPLIGGRGYYAPTYDDDNFDPISGFDIENFNHDNNEVCSISHAVNVQSSNSFVLGRVLKKSKIMHYAKTTSDAKYPLFFTFVMYDDSCTEGIPITVWNKMALQYYHFVVVGNVYAIHGYRVKDFFNTGAFPGSQFTKELSLNSDKSVIQLAGANQVKKLECEFSTTKDLLYKPDQSIVNVLGVVTCRRDPFRERILSSQQHEPSNTKFAHSIQCVINDNKTSIAVSIKLYSNSRIEDLDNLKTGDVIYFTDLILHSITTSSMLLDRQFYMTGSPCTNIIPIHEELPHFIKSTKLATKFEQLYKWRHSEAYQEPSTDWDRTYNLPYRFIPSYDMYKQQFPHEVTFFKNLYKLEKDLFMGEIRTACVQARIKSVTHKMESSDDEEEELVVDVVLQSLNYGCNLQVVMNVWKDSPFEFGDEKSVAELVNDRFVMESTQKDASEDDEMEQDEDDFKRDLNKYLFSGVFVIVLQISKQSKSVVYELMYGFQVSS
ncbi:hypothetical protein AKO1_014458 [Acrasis kona]|uniref:Uncharacterized protein n=1 Tax=Acrasis kona TaxID=1008807 RepID=A0AAW2Z0T0_9EUKA